jgi:hypothetical protein
MEVIVYECRLSSGCGQLQNPDNAIGNDLVPLFRRGKKWNPFVAKTSNDSIRQEYPGQTSLITEGQYPYICKMTTRSRNLQRRDRV